MCFACVAECIAFNARCKYRVYFRACKVLVGILPVKIGGNAFKGLGFTGILFEKKTG